MKGIKHENRASLLGYIYHLIGNSLGEACDIARERYPELPPPQSIYKRHTDKGKEGKIVESCILGIPSNSNPECDLCGLIKGEEGKEPDIKVTKLKTLKNGNMNAKERLTCTNVSREIITNEDCYSVSTYNKKCSNVLLFVLEYKKTYSLDDVLSLKILHVMYIDIYSLYKEIIDKDYHFISEMAKDSTRKLSQKGQSALHIHPHGSKGSKQRAFGYKNRFVTQMIGDDLQKKYIRSDLLIKKGNSLSIDFSKAKPKTSE
jgi:hypothetical protein